jgi:hypothetical protein
LVIVVVHKITELRYNNYNKVFLLYLYDNLLELGLLYMACNNIDFEKIGTTDWDAPRLEQLTYNYICIANDSPGLDNYY